MTSAGYRELDQLWLQPGLLLLSVTTQNCFHFFFFINLEPNDQNSRAKQIQIHEYGWYINIVWEPTLYETKTDVNNKTYEHELWRFKIYILKCLGTLQLNLRVRVILHVISLAWFYGV